MFEEEINNNYDDFIEILNSSKEFKFENSKVLVLRQYYGNLEVKLDLSKITEDMFRKIVYDPEKEKEDDYELY